MINSGGWTEGGLMGVGLATVRRASMGSGYSLKGEHRTEAYHHLLLERQTGNTYQAGWQEITTDKLEAVILVRKGAVIPTAKVAQSTKDIDWKSVKQVKY